MNNKIKIVSMMLAVVVVSSSCVTIRQDEIGVKRTFGKLSKKISNPGLAFFNPFTTTMIKVPTRTVNLEVRMNLPSKEGLSINAEVSILYRVKAKMATGVLENIGVNYEQSVILPVFRSAVSDVSARFFAKDMHTGQRAQIEKEVQTHMQELLEDRGFEIEAVLMKSIRLPDRLTQAIEEKLQAEQEAQRMEFILEREKRESERMKIQAEGIRDAQRIITEGLNPLIIQFKSLEVMQELSKSPNTKIIITDGKAPYLINQ
jgi:regulator of protease activity HflC (stomatin/prohibitin superfamily)